MVKWLNRCGHAKPNGEMIRIIIFILVFISAADLFYVAVLFMPLGIGFNEEETKTRHFEYGNEFPFISLVTGEMIYNTNITTHYTIRAFGFIVFFFHKTEI